MLFSNKPSEASRFAAPAVSLFAFGVYLITACPTVYMGDSGELTTAAFSLGVAHNSGYPLYVLLGKLFSFLPFGHIAFRLNLMSAVFAALTVWFVWSIIHDMTTSILSATVGGLMLAFAPMFWVQSSCSEVYSLHTFFVSFLTYLLWTWDQRKTVRQLALLAFMTGLSFGNHLQTVMLAPAVFFMLFTGDYKGLLRPRIVVLLGTLFLVALSLYILLPIRTNAGAALHWGDPNTWDRFLAHVTGQEHRGNYVLNKDFYQYVNRFLEIGRVLVNQFGGALLLALLGWKGLPLRWKTFFTVVCLFDLFYGVFLNIISVEVTPFGLPSCVMLALLIGRGLAQAMELIRKYIQEKMIRRAVTAAVCIIPGIPLGFHASLCNQSENYLAYEHAVNIFQTVESNGTLFVDGDNNIFPIMYSRLVEGARPDITLLDRVQQFFKNDEEPRGMKASFRALKTACDEQEKKLIQRAETGVYYAVFNPWAVAMPPGYTLAPFGFLYKVSPSSAQDSPRTLPNPWPRYRTRSMDAPFHKDFMNREVAAYYYFALGKHLVETGRSQEGFQRLALASTVGYNDDTIHLDMASFFMTHNEMAKARAELEQALLYHRDLSGVYNNWGYFYDKLGQYDKAAAFYQRAIVLAPDDHSFYNNLGLTLFRAGLKKEAREAFKKSLELATHQPALEAFLQKQEKNNRL